MSLITPPPRQVEIPMSLGAMPLFPQPLSREATPGSLPPWGRVGVSANGSATGHGRKPPSLPSPMKEGAAPTRPNPGRAASPLSRTVLLGAALSLPAALWAQTTPGDPAQAQTAAPATPVPELGTVTVIGVAPLPGLDVPKDRIPANVQNANSDDIERSQAPDLTNFMNRKLGSVYINEVQNNPLQPDLNYRGFTASPLLGTQQGLSVYMDGVRMNQPFGDVVSWDLIPKAAISSMVLMPGSNPLFGLNTLGGAVSVQTKDGVHNPGTSIELVGGSHSHGSAEFETGGSRADGWHWYATGNAFHDGGWRQASPSSAQQLFAKVGKHNGGAVGGGNSSDLTLTLALAHTDLTGNGLQDQTLMARNYDSVYTTPDNTKNRAGLINLALNHELDSYSSITANVYYRNVRTRTFNGDINDDSQGENLYLASAGENAANYPAFPYLRCLSEVALVQSGGDGEPNEKCDGMVNRTQTRQSNFGFSAQYNQQGQLLGLPNQWMVGGALDMARIRFSQGSEFGYINPNYSVTGVGLFADGSLIDDDGTPVDNRVNLRGRTTTASLFASSVLSLTDRTALTLAARYNRFHIDNHDLLNPGGGSGSLDGSYTYQRVNPGIGLTYTPVKNFTAYASVNQGSRAPSSVELGCADPDNPCKLPNAFAGDPPLKQVVTTTFEVGLRGKTAGGLVWNAGLFRSDNRDDLLFVSNSTNGFGYFKNFGKTRRQGVELGLALPLFNSLMIGANYTYLDATFRSPETVDGSANSSADDDGNISIRPGDRIPMVPRQMLKLFADWQVTPQWSLGGDLIAFGGSGARGNENGQNQPDGVNYLGSGRSPSYAVFNLNAAYQPLRGLRFFVQINNVFNRRYSTAAQLGQSIFDANGSVAYRGDGANTTFLSPGAPRSVWLGMKYSF